MWWGGRYNGVLTGATRFSKIGFIHTGLGAHGLLISRDAGHVFVSNRPAGSVSVSNAPARGAGDELPRRCGHWALRSGKRR